MVEDRALARLRAAVRRGDLVVSVHADDEMGQDDFLGCDVEHCLLTGRIVERQKDRATGERKYRVLGRSLDGRGMEIVAKLSLAGEAFVITVYEAED